MENKFNSLNHRVIKWASSKGILDNATPLTQMGKTIEEVEETRDALLAQSNGMNRYVNSKEELKDTEEEILDGFGDILVTILIGCKLQNIDPLDALQEALDIIEARTGKMVNGKFVKDK